MSSVYDIITSQVIEKLESGVIPWHKPWRTDAPVNLISQREYSGFNRVWLSATGYRRSTG